MVNELNYKILNRILFVCAALICFIGDGNCFW